MKSKFYVYFNMYCRYVETISGEKSISKYKYMFFLCNIYLFGVNFNSYLDSFQLIFVPLEEYSYSLPSI